MLIAVNERGYRIGEFHQRAKISDATVDMIRELFEDYSIRRGLISQSLDLPITTIYNICSYRCRAQVPHNWKRVHAN